MLNRCPWGVLFIACAGCIASPRPPDEHEELEELWQRYEEPTAVLDANDARTLSNASGWLGQARLIAGFQFVQSRWSDSIDRVSTSTDIRDLVRAQGKLEIREPCPGYDEDSSPNADLNGYVDVTLGVKSSAIQRTFSGVARDCRFVTVLPQGDPVQVTLTADFNADLGHTVALGGDLPGAILVEATELTLDLSTASGSTRERHVRVDFRLEPSSVETLAELPAGGVDGEGTAVVVAYSSGAVGIRVSDGEWQCGTADTACVQ